MLTLHAASEQEQEAWGRRLAAACTGACVIYLVGDLGAGKTTLARGFLRGLGHPGAVKSPTFTLLEPYRIGERACFHLDLYRLSDPGELEYIGLRDLLEGPAVLLVEWPERGIGELPGPDLEIRIRYEEKGRTLDLIPGSAVGEGLVQALGA